MNLVIFGSPGAGKGAQSARLSSHYNIVHISTGDLLRNEIKEQTSIGQEVEDMMEKGMLAPDEIITSLLSDRIKMDDCKKGFILDGYPRNIYQAELLCSGVEIYKVISIIVDDDVIIDRMTGRYICPSCSAIYNLNYAPPKEPFTCDICGAKIIQREDDKPERVKNRLDIYHEVTEPVINFFKERDLLVEVDGVGEIDAVTKSIINVLGDAK